MGSEDNTKWIFEKQPALDDFGLTSEDLVRIKSLENAINDNEIGTAWLERLLPRTHGGTSEILAIIVFLTLLWPFFLAGLLLTPVIQAIARLRLRSSAKGQAYAKYQVVVRGHEMTLVKMENLRQAETPRVDKSLLEQLALARNEQLRQYEFWRKLDGWAFEREIANLYRKRGFQVEETPGSGDGGVDLVLQRDGKRLVVQCKQHAKPVPPGIVRDLFGTMVSEGANGAILVASSGFTPGTREFANGKPITLLDLDDIIKLTIQTETSANAPRT